MSKKTLTIILIVSVGINLGLLGFMAYGALKHARLFHDQGPLPKWLDAVEGVTPEQKDQIKAIVTKGMGSMDTLRDGLFQKRCELHLLIAQKDPDLAAIDAKITEISGVQAQMETLIVHQIIAIRGVLTPEQEQLLLDYMGRHMTPPPGPQFERDRGMGPDHPMGRGYGWGRGGPDK
jgi:Spy/CpxP family protein refolding chaperone